MEYKKVDLLRYNKGGLYVKRLLFLFMIPMSALFLGGCVQQAKVSEESQIPVESVVKDYHYGEDGVIAMIPAVTGSFIQPWLCEGWTVSQWGQHLDMLLSAGIDMIILQWTAETSDGEFSFAGFPVPEDWRKSSGGFRSDATMVGRLLESAESRDMRVFMGLNTAKEWWDNAFLRSKWRTDQAEIGNSIAARLYELYKNKYPNAFYGWYWAWEMYGNRTGFEEFWSEFMNANLDFLTVLDDSMPVMFSPFLSSYYRLTPRQHETMWMDFLGATRLRAGDIFCPQDSVGATGFTLEYLGEHLAAMRRAADTKPGILFWVNNENFTKDFQPAPLDRFVSQLRMSAKFTDTHVVFSYCHYYNPYLVCSSFHTAYKAYLLSGYTE